MTTYPLHVLYIIESLAKHSTYHLYSGLQNCPNVCIFSKDLNIFAQWMNIFLKVLLYLELYYLDFLFQFRLCNLDQNSLFNELNRKYYHWGSFGTLQFYTIVWTISSNIKWKRNFFLRAINNGTWLYLYSFDMLNLVQVLSLLFTVTIRLISAVQHFLTVSLLTKGCSQHKIQTRTGLEKGTVGRINNEVERNKETHSGGCSSKLSTHNSHTILCQITTGKLNNAVQATKFINSIILDHFSF